MKILISISILLACFFTIRFVAASVSKLGQTKAVAPFRIKYVVKALNFGVVAFFAIVLFTFLGIEYSQVTIFLSSIFAVVGVALFAQWSILSNITASLIIFFGFPYRVGDHIKVLDKDDDISGVVEEISLFHVLIRKDGHLISYPNNLIIQKAVLKSADGSALSSPIEPPTSE